MKITLALQSPKQVSGACQTTAYYVRIGYPYCSLIAQQIWPIKELRKSISTILAVGKIPQLILPFCPLEEKEEDYWEQHKKLLKIFPQAEVVISNWGMIRLPVANHKIASAHLNILNSKEITLLEEAGIYVAALPLSLREGQLIRRLINNNPDIEFQQLAANPA